MAKVYQTPIDLSKLELLNARVQNLASAPSTPVTGQIYYDTAASRFLYWNGTTWANRATISDDASLLQGQTLIQVRARSNHTGTQTASTISDFDTQVRLSRLDQLAIPTASVNLNSQKITGLLAGTASSDAINFQQLQDAKNNVDRKDSVRVAQSTNVTLAGPGTTVDGVAMVAGESFLAYGQTNASENGIYVWNGAAVAATRRSDADVSAEVTAGLTTVVEEGTQSDKRAILVTNNPIVLGTTGLVFTFETTGESVVAGNGLTKTGSTLDVGTGTGISITADAIAIDTVVVVRKAAFNVGDAAALAFVLTHNLNTKDVTVAVYLNSGSFDEQECDVEHTSLNTITLRFAVAPATNAYRCVVHG